MKEAGRISNEDLMPDVTPYRIIIECYRELQTERGMGLIPISTISAYIDRHRLPDYWVNIIHAIDTAPEVKENGHDGASEASS